jgi:ABC-type antimicrobial peptide transport system permease subunit
MICPPKLFLRFFRWYCHPKLLDHIEGDLIELYQQRVSKVGKRTADIKFTIDVVLLFRPSIIRSGDKSSHAINLNAMLRHNLLITTRAFYRHRNSFLINLIGLSTGLACTFLIYLWVSDELSVDKFHEKESRLFRAMENRVGADGIRTSRSASGLLGESLATEMPEVEYALNSSAIQSYTLSANEKNIKSNGQFAGKDFFKMFSHHLTRGNESQVLSDKNSIVISDELAIKLFNTTEDVVGKSIRFNHDAIFLISGIFQKVPSNSTEQFDFVCSFEKHLEANDWLKDWSITATYAFVQLKKGVDVAAFNRKINDYIKLKTHNQVTHRTLFLKQFSEDYLLGKYENGIQAGGRITYINLFSTIAIFIMVIACINFMNLATAKASVRVKEVGIKKAMGASRTALVGQFLTESMLISMLSLFLSVAIVYVLLPQFNEITGKHLTLQLDQKLILSILAIVTITGLMAGSYPALYLSGFTPASVLKGKLTTSFGELWTRKGLVIFQFTLTVIFIVSMLVVYKQMKFVQSKYLGYNKDNIIYFPLEGELKKTVNQETFIAEMKNIPGVVSASSISHDMTGHSRGTYNVNWENKDPDDRTEFEVFTVNYDMLELLGIEMAAGRTFSKLHSAENTSVIFNEAAIKFMGIKNPIGKKVKLNEEMEIIGVVKNFHFQSLHENIKPVFFIVNPDDTHLLMGKFSIGMQEEVLVDMERLYKKFNPDFPFDFQFLDEEYTSQYVAEQRVAILSKYFTRLAILISSLGLFGLAAFTAERRTKEIGIRKVLGSSEFAIVFLLTSEFTKIVLASILLALPLSFFISSEWLSNFAFKIELEWWYFVSAGLLTLFIAWITVGLQTIKAARASPVNSLRSE